jgi:hypothetical protein
VNTVRTGVVTWLTCSGEIFVRDGTVVGVRTDDYDGARIAIAHERSNKPTTDPEFIFDAFSVALALGQDAWRVLEPVGGRGPEALQWEPRQPE